MPKLRLFVEAVVLVALPALQVVQINTVVGTAGLRIFVVAAPTSFSGKAEPIFKQMIETIKFAD
jgi:hypothetical protein